jgi:hypothetical protein
MCQLGRIVSVDVLASDVGLNRAKLRQAELWQEPMATLRRADYPTFRAENEVEIH